MNFDAFDSRIPLSTKLSAAVERLKYYTKNGKWASIYLAIVFISVSILVLGGAFMFVWSLSDYINGSEDAPLGLVIMMGLIFVAAIYLVIYGISQVGKYIYIMKRFALDNNLEFHPNIKVNESAGFAFAAKTRKFARNGVTGKVNGRKFWLYEYRFFSGTGRYPYPNIFTVFLVQLDKSYSQTTFINKKGRLKIMWPKTGIKEVLEPWYDADNLRVYTENGQVDQAVTKLLSDKKIQQILQINPKAEIEIKDTALRIFLPEKPLPTKEEAKKLFAFAESLK